MTPAFAQSNSEDVQGEIDGLFVATSVGEGHSRAGEFTNVQAA